MLQIGLVVAWLIALGLAIHLATTAIKARLLGQRERRRTLKTAREFRKTTISILNRNVGCEMWIKWR